MNIGLSSLIQTKTNILILRFLNRQLAQLYLYALVRLYYLITDRQNKNLKNVIGHAFPHLTPAELEKTVKNIYLGIAKHYAEKIHNIVTSVSELISFFDTKINGQENLKEFLGSRQDNKGVLLLTGHFGGVEYLPLFLRFKNCPISIIADFSSRWLTARSLSYARRYGINVINASTSTNGMQEIFKDLRRGRIVIFLIDEIKYWEKAPQGTIAFLNRSMPFFRGLSTIAKGCLHYQIPLYFGALLRRQGEYEFFAEKIPPASAPADRLARQILHRFEKAIAERPDHWYQWKKFSEAGQSIVC